MPREKITETLKSGKILISDGAWGTLLQTMGLRLGECPEFWNITRPGAVRGIAAGYAAAGADIVKTNSIGGSAFKLAHYGLAGRASEINEAAARLSREAAGDSRWVMASMGPTGKMLVTEEVTEEELYDAFKLQALAFERGGADAVLIETMSDVAEAVQAIRAAKENTGLEIICTFTFDKTVRGDYRTIMGADPVSANRAAAEAGADVVGTNCGNGIGRMVEIVEVMRAADKVTPILVQSNAGRPCNIGGVDAFPDTPEDMAEAAPRLVAAGANIIGGCCGTTPEHIRRMKAAVENARFA